MLSTYSQSELHPRVVIAFGERILVLELVSVIPFCSHKYIVNSTVESTLTD